MEEEGMEEEGKERREWLKRVRRGGNGVRRGVRRGGNGGG